MLPLTRFRKRTRFFGVSGPSLALDFVNGGALDPRITFSRASSATLFDSSGTLVYAPMNLLTYSEEFDNPAWTKARSSITANATNDPQGFMTADKLVEDTTASATHQIQLSVSYTSGTTYTRSLYAKAAERTGFRFQFPSSAFTSALNAYFDLATGTVAATSTGVTATITPVGNGWYRCTATATAAATASGTEISCGLTVTATNPIYTGDGTSGIFIWGAQLNISNMQGGVTADLSTYYPTTTAAYQGPRLDYNPATLAARGLLIEEQRTNGIRNNTGVGAVAGTPGTAPTNWSIPSPSAGLSAQIIGTGVEAGITYIDVRYFGTATGTNVIIAFETTTQIAALNGQTWTNSVWVKVISGAANNYTLRTSLRDSGGAGLGQIDTLFAPTSTLTRFFNTGTLADASVAFVAPQIRFGLATGVAYDITLRIGLPQLELGAFATSVIPTTTTALTRSADVASVNTLSPWYSATEGTLYSESSGFATNSRIASFSNNSSSNRIHLARGTGFGGNVNATVTVSGAAQVSALILGSSLASGVLTKAAFAYKQDDFAGTVNGGTVVTDTTGTIPTVTQLMLGNGDTLGANVFNGYLRRITYYPRRLSNAELQSITS